MTEPNSISSNNVDEIIQHFNEVQKWEQFEENKVLRKQRKVVRRVKQAEAQNKRRAIAKTKGIDLNKIVHLKRDVANLAKRLRLIPSCFICPKCNHKYKKSKQWYCDFAKNIAYCRSCRCKEAELEKRNLVVNSSKENRNVES